MLFWGSKGMQTGLELDLSREVVGTRSNGRKIVKYYGRKKLQWDGENMKIKNLEEANNFVSKEYRNGWELPI